MKITLKNTSGTSSLVKVENKNNIGRVNFDGYSSRRVNVENKNNIGRVIFNKVGSRGNTTLLTQLADVNISLQQEGDVLVYNANTNSYFIKTLPRIDGGTF